MWNYIHCYSIPVHFVHIHCVPFIYFVSSQFVSFMLTPCLGLPGFHSYHYRVPSFLFISIMFISTHAYRFNFFFPLVFASFIPPSYFYSFHTYSLQSYAFHPCWPVFALFNIFHFTLFRFHEYQRVFASSFDYTRCALISSLHNLSRNASPAGASPQTPGRRDTPGKLAAPRLRPCLASSLRGPRISDAFLYVAEKVEVCVAYSFIPSPLWLCC